MRRNVDSGMKSRNLSVTKLKKNYDFNYIIFIYLKKGSSSKNCISECLKAPRDRESQDMVLATVLLLLVVVAVVVLVVVFVVVVDHHLHLGSINNKGHR